MAGKMKKSRRRSAQQRLASGTHNEYRIFISHATKDKWIARMICEKLEAVGAKTFRDDRDIEGGDDIPDQIRKAIKRSHEFLLLLTPESKDRPWVLIELGVAWGTRKTRRIVAVLHHLEAEAIPGAVAWKRAISLNDFDNYVLEVKSRVERTRK